MCVYIYTLGSKILKPGLGRTCPSFERVDPSDNGKDSYMHSPPQPVLSWLTSEPLQKVKLLAFLLWFI